ncbi:hypothetical protein [Sphingomonas sp. SCN 67-18]|mgnify:CR=1 FL=1|nr:hypothetical protein [Sphingomonas sp. SCN 67-18]
MKALMIDSFRPLRLTASALRDDALHKHGRTAPGGMGWEALS